MTEKKPSKGERRRRIQASLPPLSEADKIQIRTSYSNRLKPKRGRPLKRLKHRDAIMAAIEEKHLAVLPDIRVDHPGLYDTSPYTPGDKIAAVIAYMTAGNAKKASEYCGVPYATISKWKKDSDWWPVVQAQIRKEKNDQLDNTYTAIVEAATSKLMERITLGDVQVDTKTGATAYKPVSARDLAIVTGTIQDKRSLLRGDATSISGKEKTQEDILSELRTSFKKVAEQDGVLIEAEEEK